MIDLGISKMALIGAVALIVIGPEKLPRVARTVGTLLGKAQRYVNDVKAEVNRSMDLDELRKMKDTVQDAARDVEQQHPDRRQRLREAVLRKRPDAVGTGRARGAVSCPEYKHPRKNWRLKQGATPQWYKARNGVRTKALSGRRARRALPAPQDQLAAKPAPAAATRGADVAARSAPPWPTPPTKTKKTNWPAPSSRSCST